MQKSKSQLRARLAAMLGMGVSAYAHGLQSDFLTSRPRFPKVRVTNRYPEQSSRQSMRGARRQQGGNGLVLTSEFVYVKR